MNYLSQQAEVSNLIQRYKSGFRVLRQTREEIRRRAAAVRPLLLRAGDNFDIETFLESLIMYNITYDIVEDYELPRGVEASCYPDQLIIHITLSTFNDIVANEGRARFTLFMSSVICSWHIAIRSTGMMVARSNRWKTQNGKRISLPLKC